MERNGGSRLLQMQARFQQKQLQEREMKIASLYEAQQARALDRVRHSPTIALVSPPEPHQPGKVRQMFEERRTKAGIDKSYPLQPISTNKQPLRKPMTNGKVTSSGTTTAMANGHRVTTSSRVTNTVERKTRTTANVTSTVRKTQHKTHNVVNGSGDLNHNHETDFNANKHTHPHSNGEADEDRPDYRLEDETFPDALEPAATPRSPEPAPARSEPQRPPRRSPATKTAPKYSPPVAPPRRVTSENAVSEGRAARGAMQRTQAPTTVTRKPVVSGRSSVAGAGGAGRAGAAVRRAAPAGAGSADGVPCAVCGRRFASDRLDKHQEICRRTQNKKRKPFDALKHRLQGTEAEQFIGKLRKPASSNQSSTKVGKPLPNSNWRKKHEEFITAIRAAKQVQQHLAAGGKLSDLPPPPPSENPDYIQCPHCNRRFNQAAAERHIPKCADFQYNKPKPNTTRKR